jgi:hypothetical protein
LGTEHAITVSLLTFDSSVFWSGRIIEGESPVRLNHIVQIVSLLLAATISMHAQDNKDEGVGYQDLVWGEHLRGAIDKLAERRIIATVDRTPSSWKKNDHSRIDVVTSDTEQTAGDRVDIIRTWVFVDSVFHSIKVCRTYHNRNTYAFDVQSIYAGIYERHGDSHSIDDNTVYWETKDAFITLSRTLTPLMNSYATVVVGAIPLGYLDSEKDYDRQARRSRPASGTASGTSYKAFEMTGLVGRQILESGSSEADIQLLKGKIILRDKASISSYALQRGQNIHPGGTTWRAVDDRGKNCLISLTEQGEDAQIVFDYGDFSCTYKMKRDS